MQKYELVVFRTIAARCIAAAIYGTFNHSHCDGEIILNILDLPCLQKLMLEINL